MSADLAAEGAVEAAHEKDASDSGLPQGGIAGKSPLQIALGRLRRDWLAMICLAIVVLFALIAIFAPLICKIFGVSTDTVLASSYLDWRNGLPLKGPPLHGFDPNHPFGIAPKTADDNLAWWVYGCRTSLEIATMATVVSTVIGVTLGLLAGFLGGIVDKVISFFTDLFLTIPFILAALVLAPIINQRFNTSSHYSQIQFWVLVAILSFFYWMSIARLVRGEVLSLREREFVQAARVLGMPTRRILFRELLPNLTGPIIVSVSLALPTFVSAEAGLAYLGIGLNGAVSWGQVILKASDYFDTYPLYLWEPLLGVVVLVLALNLLGDAVRDAFDPKTRR
ncbi:ABC transporter permease [Nocardioides sp. KR10-350]|uniref:ABC transporter permease n=1 Tax=Nocardioides cheoyonin TaxID=3156615 RepID=UPI0032B34234